MVVCGANCVGEGPRDNCPNDANARAKTKTSFNTLPRALRGLAKAEMSRLLNTLPKFIAVPWYV